MVSKDIRTRADRLNATVGSLRYGPGGDTATRPHGQAGVNGVPNGANGVEH